MATRTVNTVTASATTESAESPLDYKSGLFSYQLSLSLLKTMLKNNIITEPDYNKCRNTFAQKYGISLCSIFA